jgi:DNA-binding response OmpR family regulator
LGLPLPWACHHRIPWLSFTESGKLSVSSHNRGRLLTRERLLDEVWGTWIAVTDRVIDNHIVALRKKIEDEPTAPRYLISVRGVGYRFDG